MVNLHLLRSTLKISLLSVLFIAMSGQPAVRNVYFPLLVNSSAPPRTFEMRAVWVQPESILSREKIDEMLLRVEKGHFREIFVVVFFRGQALFDSNYASKYEQIEPEFNPLAYLVPEAHRRDLEVHAWFVAGWVGDRDESPVLKQHPDWALVRPDGGTTGWINFNRPDVRQFIRSLMKEVVETYHVDGVHFDYTRYPGPAWGFDPYSIETFSKLHGYDLNLLRYADLPAYGTFKGNPLTQPSTAQILASFSNGIPAVTLNQYGEGEVILLNWNANRRDVAVGSEILKRSLERLQGEEGEIYLLRSRTNAEKYGSEGLEEGREWLIDLGWEPLEVQELKINELSPDSVLVAVNVYLITPETAAQMENFVNQGGGIIFVDGPTPSIGLKDLQAITGMLSRGIFFEKELVISAEDNHPLIPNSNREVDLDTFRERDEEWKDFRREGINTLVRNVYICLKRDDPNVRISATITGNQQAAFDTYLQDWPDWLNGGYLDLLVPRAYVDQVEELEPIIKAWQPYMTEFNRAALGIIAYTGSGESREPKDPEQLVTEVRLVLASGSKGVFIFDLDNMSDEQLHALAEGPFALQNIGSQQTGMP